jgi:hypothetical protein
MTGPRRVSVDSSRALGGIGRLRRSTRNPLGKSSVAQILDENRLMGSLHFPEAFFSEDVVRAQ